MHCTICDKLLTAEEDTRKHSITGEYLELCDDCLDAIGEIEHIPTNTDCIDPYDDAGYACDILGDYTEF